jgi:hypothetical protein
VPGKSAPGWGFELSKADPSSHPLWTTTIMTRKVQIKDVFGGAMVSVWYSEKARHVTSFVEYDSEGSNSSLFPSYYMVARIVQKKE